MSLNKRHLGTLKKQYLAYAEARRTIIKQSDEALHNAKRAIFSLHRGNNKEAKEKLAKSLGILKKTEGFLKKGKAVKMEGAYKAALEEFVEATLFLQFIETGKIGKISEMEIPSEIYIAGICDVPGELYRYAIKAATNKDIKTVKACANMAQDISGELIEFNLTSYLRNKFDQAKGMVRKIENVVYELSLREES